MTTADPPSDQTPRYHSIGYWVLTVILPVLILGGLLTLGILPRVVRNAVLAQDADQARQHIIPVRIINPQLANDTMAISLPGTLQALHETYIYGRANGYIRSWYTDIGTNVRRGQLMALIETPELDQQLQQAKANLALADVSLKRLESISMPGAITRQSLDDRKNAYATSLAVVRQLEAMTAFKRVIAPFSGVVTVRNVDVGSLVNGGSAGGQALFRLDRVDSLKLLIAVPQSYVTSIRPGLRVQAGINEYPNRHFTGVIVRTAGALDATTRTLLTEINLANSKGLLYAGMYAQAKLLLNRRERIWSLPDNALYIGSAGPQVVVVNPDNRVHFQTVTVGRDFGATIEVLTGLRDGDRLVVNPNDDLYEGGQVHILNVPSSKLTPTDKPAKTP